MCSMFYERCQLAWSGRKNWVALRVFFFFVFRTCVPLHLQLSPKELWEERDLHRRKAPKSEKLFRDALHSQCTSRTYLQLKRNYTLWQHTQDGPVINFVDETSIACLIYAERVYMWNFNLLPGIATNVFNVFIPLMRAGVLLSPRN